MPTNAVDAVTMYPGVVSGTTSPYPTVVIVMTAKYMPSKADWKALTLPFESMNTLPSSVHVPLSSVQMTLPKNMAPTRDRNSDMTSGDRLIFNVPDSSCRRRTHTGHSQAGISQARLAIHRQPSVKHGYAAHPTLGANSHRGEHQRIKLLSAASNTKAIRCPIAAHSAHTCVHELYRVILKTRMTLTTRTTRTGPDVCTQRQPARQNDDGTSRSLASKHTRSCRSYQAKERLEVVRRDTEYVNPEHPVLQQHTHQES